MKPHLTLTESIALAPDHVRDARHTAGDNLWNRAVEFHRRTHLRVDLDTSTVRNDFGFVSQFVAYDWRKHYDDHPEHVFFDFFLGKLAKSCDRMRRGLEP